jgi:hypothetical protein
MIMRNTMLFGPLAILFVLALAAPAGTISVGGTEYTLLANKLIGLESGPRVIDGNVGVNDRLGTLKIGQGVTINGTATAHRIEAGSNQQTTKCVFDILVGAGAAGCLTQESPAPLPIVDPWPPIAIAPPPACVATAANFRVPPGETLFLPPGCYGVVTVGAGGTLTLAAGTYNVRDLAVQQGGEVDGAGKTETVVNSKKVVTTLHGSVLKGLTLENALSTTAEVLQIGPGSQLDDILLYAPFAGVHIHSGTVWTNTDIIAK